MSHLYSARETWNSQQGQACLAVTTELVSSDMQKRPERRVQLE